MPNWPLGKLPQVQANSLKVSLVLNGFHGYPPPDEERSFDALSHARTCVPNQLAYETAADATTSRVS